MSSSKHQGWDPVWEKIFRAQEWGKYPPEHVIRFVARNFYKAPDRKTIRLLEIGCGPGACVWYMAREGFAVSGIDGSSTAIRLAGERLAAEKLSADLQTGDFHQLPWPDNYFNGVIDNAAIYSNPLSQGIITVKEVYRVLKPGGLFSSCNFTDRTWGYGLGDEIEPGGFINLREGPLAGKGFALFMGRSQVDELYRIFPEKTVESMSYTMSGMAHQVEYWNVTCRKTTD